MNAEYAVWSAIDQEDDELMKQGKTKSKFTNIMLDLSPCRDYVFDGTMLTT